MSNHRLDTSTPGSLLEDRIMADTANNNNDETLLGDGVMVDSTKISDENLLPDTSAQLAETQIVTKEGRGAWGDVSVRGEHLFKIRILPLIY